MNVNRRNFLKNSLFGVVASLGAPFSGLLQNIDQPDGNEPASPEGLVVDTNVHISQWPFRNLKYGETSAMVSKLRKHGIREAWTGSYDALFHKNIDSVNARLAEACHQYGGGLLVPFGTVNPRWPDWEEDLRRCDEEYGMRGIRLYPGYQNYTLELPEFAALLRNASDRGMMVQVAIDQEDERMQHPQVEVPAVDVSPLPDILESVPGARLQLLNPFRHVRGRNLEMLVENTDVSFGISNLDGNGALERIIAGSHWSFGNTVIPAERLLIGSHVPYRPVENVLFKLMESKLSEEDAAAIMSENANRMLRTVSHSDYNFAVNPSALGLPSRDELVDMRIWDGHYHGFLTGGDPIEQHKQIMSYIDRMGIERVVSVDVGGTIRNPLEASDYDDEIRRLLKTDKEKVTGITPIEPGYPHESCKKMEAWIRNGPCIGIKYVGGNEFGITCDHPNSDRIIALAKELKAVIYIHSWIKVGGTPRYAGGGNISGESTPMDVARLAARFPDVQMICGHQGGDWELGIRAIRPHENVLLEFSGALPTSGAVDLAVNELGADRIVWGGHGPSRSYANELSKVYDADLTDEQRMKIFGRNYRKLAAPIMRQKGYSVSI